MKIFFHKFFTFSEVLSPRKRAPEEVIKDDMSPSKKTKTAESEEEKKEVVEPES